MLFSCLSSSNQKCCSPKGVVYPGAGFAGDLSREFFFTLAKITQRQLPLDGVITKWNLPILRAGPLLVDAGDFKHHVADHGVDQFESGQDAGIAVNHHAVYAHKLAIDTHDLLGFYGEIIEAFVDQISAVLDVEANALHYEALQSDTCRC